MYYLKGMENLAKEIIGKVNGALKFFAYEGSALYNDFTIDNVINVDEIAEALHLDVQAFNSYRKTEETLWYSIKQVDKESPAGTTAEFARMRVNRAKTHIELYAFDKRSNLVILKTWKRDEFLVQL